MTPARPGKEEDTATKVHSMLYTVTERGTLVTTNQHSGNAKFYNLAMDIEQLCQFFCQFLVLFCFCF